MEKEQSREEYSEAWKFQNEYSRTMKLIHPKGVFRFKTFEEADEWQKKYVKVVRIDPDKK